MLICPSSFIWYMSHRKVRAAFLHDPLLLWRYHSRHDEKTKILNILLYKNASVKIMDKLGHVNYYFLSCLSFWLYSSDTVSLWFPTEYQITLWAVQMYPREFSLLIFDGPPSDSHWFLFQIHRFAHFEIIVISCLLQTVIISRRTLIVQKKTRRHECAR